MLAPYALERAFDNERHYPTGATLSFDKVLTGDTITQLPLIISSWRRAFAHGIGPGNGTADLIAVEHIDAHQQPTRILDEHSPALRPHDTHIRIPVYMQPENIHLHITTPMRLEQKGQRIGNRELTPGIFLRHLIRRVSLHISNQGQDAYTKEQIHSLNTMADQVQESGRQLHWRDWERHSSRQHQKMTLGGLMGHWTLQQVPAELLPFIYLGQWLHIGKETAFGLGRYHWQPQPGTDNTKTGSPQPENRLN